MTRPSPQASRLIRFGLPAIAILLVAASGVWWLAARPPEAPAPRLTWARVGNDPNLIFGYLAEHQYARLGDWRLMAEPARHLWATLGFEFHLAPTHAAWPEDPRQPTFDEVVGGYQAMGLEQVATQVRNLEPLLQPGPPPAEAAWRAGVAAFGRLRPRIATARDAYIQAHAAAIIDEAPPAE